MASVTFCLSFESNKFCLICDLLKIRQAQPPAHLEMLEWDSAWGRFVDSIPYRIKDESLVFCPIVFVDAVHPIDSSDRPGQIIVFVFARKANH